MYMYTGHFKKLRLEQDEQGEVKVLDAEWLTKEKNIPNWRMLWERMTTRPNSSTFVANKIMINKVSHCHKWSMGCEK